MEGVIQLAPVGFSNNSSSSIHTEQGGCCEAGRAEDGGPLDAGLPFGCQLTLVPTLPKRGPASKANAD